MADRTESSIAIAAAPADVLTIISDFEAYPEWTGAVKKVTVEERLDDGRGKRVTFNLDAGAIRDTYTLDYDWTGVAKDGTGSLSWTLVDSNVLKALDGTYALAPDAQGTLVRYQLAVELRIPMLGMLRRKAEKQIIDTALKELKKQAEA
jgi:ribosome-associated toxin RatA of RatAB toxin-antitoxin module